MQLTTLHEYKFDRTRPFYNCDNLNPYKMLTIVFWTVLPNGLVGGYQHYEETNSFNLVNN
jgi:hypothetical protein